METEKTTSEEKSSSNSVFIAYATGSGSILDISGNDESFRSLVRHEKEYESSLQAIGSDFDAVGDYLESAIIEYFRTLSREDKIRLIKKIYKTIHDEESIYNDYDNKEEVKNKKSTTIKFKGQHPIVRLEKKDRGGGEE